MRTHAAASMPLLLLSVSFTQSARADDPPTADPATLTAAPPASEGLLPIPDYTGDLLHRRYLTGDWGGPRTDLANKGFQFQANWDQYFQSVIDGGRDTESEYGGHLNYLFNFDLMRMGVLPGALVKLRAESRYGQSVNPHSGAILPVNVDSFFPLTDELDEDVPFTITNFNLTQFLSPKFAVILGKLDTLDGDPNEFASGRGVSQFMNANFVFNSAMALRLPYSTLGAGVVWMPVRTESHSITVSSLVINTVDSSTTSGFDDFGDGNSWTTEASFQYRVAGRPGGQNLGFLYSFDQDFTRIPGRVTFTPGEGLSLPTEDETWAIYWSAWQYLYVEAPAESLVDLTNGQPDHQGFGFFARVGFADQDTNPIAWSISAGLGGRGIIPTRDNDTFGLGLFYTDVQSTRLSGIANLEDHGQGFEAFYNIAITPAAHLTLDAQIVEPVSTDLDTAVILGLRLNLVF